MRRNDAMLAILVILVLGFAIWLFYTGIFNSAVVSAINQIWSSLQGMLRPIFRR